MVSKCFGSGLPHQEAPIMIAEKRQAWFSFLMHVDEDLLRPGDQTNGFKESFDCLQSLARCRPIYFVQRHFGSIRQPDVWCLHVLSICKTSASRLQISCVYAIRLH
ncbi:TPA: hypothetical protein ACH3X1_013874 [Trebouxia sp. C0004]